MVTSAEVVQEVRKIAEQSPDFIYGAQLNSGVDCSYVGSITCAEYKYVHPDQKSKPESVIIEEYYEKLANGELESPCIVGQSLQNLGVSQDMLLHFEGQTADTVVEYFADESTSNDLQWLYDVQNKQDNGSSWGEAVKATDVISII